MKGATDLDHLPGRNREVAYQTLRADLGVREVREEFEGSLARMSPVEPPPTRGLRPKNDVLHHGEVGTELEFLMDESDPSPTRLERRGGCKGLSHEEHLSGIRSQSAGHDVHQSALPGAILPDQPMNLAAHHGKAHIVERNRRTEAPNDPPQIKCGGVSA
jgi:hypothetical protein